jgi:hypothetical protein
LGNSIVSSARTKPEPRFTGTIDTSKVDGQISNQLSGLNGKITDDFNASQAKQNAQIAAQASENLNAQVEAQQLAADVKFEASLVARHDAGARHAESVLTNRFNLDTKANALGDRTFNTLQRVNQLVNTPIQDRASFKAGLARGKASYLNSLHSRTTAGLDLRGAVVSSGLIEVPDGVSGALGASGKLADVTQRISTTTRTSVELAQSFDAYGQVLNSQARNVVTDVAFNTSPLGEIAVAPSALSSTVLPHSSIYGPDGVELIRLHGDRLTSNTSARLLDADSSTFKVLKRLGTAGDVLEFGVDTYNNFAQDGNSARAYIASIIDAGELAVSGVASTAAGVLVGGAAGTATLATGVGAPAAPAVAVTTGVATGVAVDAVIDSIYTDYLREPIINSVLSVYEFGRDTYNYFAD